VTDHSPENPQRSGPYVDESLVINTRLSVLEKQEAEDKKYQRDYNKKQLTFNGILAFFTVLLFCSNLASDILLFRQTSASKESADAARSAAETAANEFGITKRITESNNEAICNVAGGFDSEENVVEDAGVNNTGKVNALHIAAHVEITRNHLPQLESIAVLQTADINGDEIQPVHGINRHLQIHLTNQEKENIHRRLEATVLKATLEYDNGFGTIKHRTFCTVYVSTSDLANMTPTAEIDCDRLPVLLKTISRTQRKGQQ
jgi:hypothetical protein